MRLSIAAKIILLITSAVATSCVIVFLLTLNLLEPPLQTSLDSNIRMMQGMVSEIYKADAQKLLRNASLLAEAPHLVSAVDAQDREALADIGKQLMQKIGVELVTITDAQGRVLGRGHADTVGDNIAALPVVANALKGEMSVGADKTNDRPLSLRAGAPILHDKKRIGTISIGISLVSPAYVDKLKEASGGLEVTIFQGDVRAMTTILRDGQRITGTKLDAPHIIRAVLGEGATRFGDLSIQGTNYKVAYWPIMDTHQTPVGMLFTGSSLETVEAARHDALIKAALAMLGVTLVFALLALVSGKRLAAPIRSITTFATRIASGDLDAHLRVTSSDETATLADSLHTMVGALKDRIAESQQQSELARQETDRAKAAVEEAEQARREAEHARHGGMLEAAGKLEGITRVIADVSEKLSAQIARCEQGASEQAARVAETATAMEEMNSTVLEVARNAAAAAEMSTMAHGQAVNGADIVHQAVNGVQDLRNESLALKAGMADLSVQAQAINQIMSVISDIADQTNLLALNAAIEAARAGDAGRGFAVVADEVRKLAEKTMHSTADVDSAIKGIQQGTNTSMEQVDLAVQHIEEVTRHAESSGGALQEIVGIVDRTSDQIRTIATASEEQSATSEEINNAIGQVNHIAEETLSIMTAATQAVQDLVGQSQVLSDLVAELKQA